MEMSNQKGNNIKNVILVAVTAMITAIVVIVVIFLLFKYYPSLFGDTVTNINKTEKEVTVTDTGIADAVEKVYDSVVIVKTYKSNQLYATGTGFIYKEEDGVYYLLTNYHVIESGDSVSVVFTNNEEEVVNIVNGDKYADIAVLSYETDAELTVAEIGSSVDARVGDTVFAIGSPIDSSVYSWSVTRGVLSGKDREISVSTSNSNTSDWIMQVLQTDAAINSGNSGGPLCNSNGEVIGITNMKLVTSSVEGMGFAIPIEEAETYADAVISGEDVSRPYVGISMVDASNTYYAQSFGISATEGVLLSDVASDSPADKAGLKKGDVITAINDSAVTSVASLRYQLYKYKVGETITVTYLRDGKTKTTDLTLVSSQ